MTEILVNASAPDRATALAMIVALGIAEITQEQVETVPGYWTWQGPDDEGNIDLRFGQELPEGYEGTWHDPYDIVHPGGQIFPLMQVHIGEVPHSGTRSLWNFWYYGETAAALFKPYPEEGWYDGADIFEKTTILDMIDLRTGMPMQWAPFLGPDGEPPGYETPNGIRLYDPSLISSSNLVKQ